MWTQGWAEWDPQNKVYPAPTTTVTGTLTANQNWAAGTTVLLQGPVYVKNCTITIAPGVVVLGSKAVAGSALIICRGSQLIANGTASLPIVFSSDQAEIWKSVEFFLVLLNHVHICIYHMNGCCFVLSAVCHQKFRLHYMMFDFVEYRENLNSN